LIVILTVKRCKAQDQVLYAKRNAVWVPKNNVVQLSKVEKIFQSLHDLLLFHKNCSKGKVTSKWFSSDTGKGELFVVPRQPEQKWHRLLSC